jgi:hypothetical protein
MPVSMMAVIDLPEHCPALIPESVGECQIDELISRKGAKAQRRKAAKEDAKFFNRLSLRLCAFA